MADETTTTPRAEAPAGPGGRPGGRPGGPGGPGGRKFFRRKKVCKFCTEKIDAISYRDVRLLQGFVAERGKIVSHFITFDVANAMTLHRESAEKATQARRKAIGDGTLLVVGATPGEAYQGIDWGDAWPFHNESMQAYGEKRYADALEAVRGALEHMPDHAGLNYNYACFATLAGNTGDDTFAHLRRAVELHPRFREDARRDDDFAAVRDDPRFEQALR